MKNFLEKSVYDDIRSRALQLSQNHVALWGKMTVNQMVCHISDPIRDVLGIRMTEPVVPEEMRPQVIAMVMIEPDWEKNLPTFPPYLQAPEGGGTTPSDFTNDKEAFLDLMKKLFETKPSFSYQAHAGLGKLDRNDTGCLIWKHCDHHLRQFGL